jgi:hypothetical protein
MQKMTGTKSALDSAGSVPRPGTVLWSNTKAQPACTFNLREMPLTSVVFRLELLLPLDYT